MMILSLILALQTAAASPVVAAQDSPRTTTGSSTFQILPALEPTFRSYLDCINAAMMRHRVVKDDEIDALSGMVIGECKATRATLTADAWKVLASNGTPEPQRAAEINSVFDQVDASFNVMVDQIRAAMAADKKQPKS